MAKKQAINTDEIVLKLQSQIKNREQELLNISKPSWKTNNSIELFGTRYNLNVQTTEQLALLFSHVVSIFNNLKLSNEILGTEVNEYFGFTLDEWKHDFSLHVVIKNKRIKEKQLQVLKDKVANLLSDELKTKLMLEEINKELDNI